MNNNNENNEHKSELNVEAMSFKLDEPLDDEQRRLMYRAIASTMNRFAEMDTLYDERFPKDTPDRDVKRAFAMASDMAESVVEFLEKHGYCINMDSAAMQGVLTPLLLQAPVIACNSLAEVRSYLEGEEQK